MCYVAFVLKNKNKKSTEENDHSEGKKQGAGAGRGRGGGEGGQKGEDICIRLADPRCCAAETKRCKATIPQ